MQKLFFAFDNFDFIVSQVVKLIDQRVNLMVEGGAFHEDLPAPGVACVNLSVPAFTGAIRNPIRGACQPCLQTFHFSTSDVIFSAAARAFIALWRDNERRASRLHECFGAIAVEAFPGGKGFGGKAAVQGWFHA